MSEQRRFLNTHQPRTLVIATVLLYIEAFFLVFRPFMLTMVLAFILAAGAFGIANERRWGYNMGIVGAVLNFLLTLYSLGGLSAFQSAEVFYVIIPGALVLLLIHPESRNYERIYFR